MNVVVTGWVAPFPTAGFLWHPLSYVLGFTELGHDAWYLEDSGDSPWGWDPSSGVEDPACAAGVRFLDHELSAMGLGERWVFRHMPTGRHHGMSRTETLDRLRDADVLVNVSLTTPMRPEYRQVPQRLGIDTDPVFTQIRIATNDVALRDVPDDHTRLFSFGRPPLPASEHEWIHTRQPVAAAAWPVSALPDAPAPFTTLTTWQAYIARTWAGVDYGAKDRSFRQLLDLPSRVPQPLEVALGAGSNQAEGHRLLREHGWQLSDPLEASRSTAHYHAFLARSAGEIGVAKHGYVVARSGWFSERSCCYLASGRPVVAQDTGWSEWLPTGEGLFAFTSADEAAEAMKAVYAEPARQAAAARRIAEEHFAAADVCRSLLDAL